MTRYKFDDLLAIMSRLRGPDGCPWDREQTHESLIKYLVEEVYEFVDTVFARDEEGMKDELGDVLLQVVFHAQLASDENYFNIKDVIQNICEKLIRRHPHVFGNSMVKTSDGVIKQWEKIKEKEKSKTEAEKQSVLKGIPKSLPPFEKTLNIQNKVAKAGFDWKDQEGPMQKIFEEISELSVAVADYKKQISKKPDMIMEFGDLLFSMINLARHLDINPSEALSMSNKKFTQRFTRMEKAVKADGKHLSKMTSEEMDAYWEKEKNEI